MPSSSHKNSRNTYLNEGYQQARQPLTIQLETIRLNNSIIWKAARLSLKAAKLPDSKRELVAKEVAKKVTKMKKKKNAQMVYFRG